MAKCPTCKKPVPWKDNRWRPFCSERCQLIDFGRWADGEYYVPGSEMDAPEFSEPPPSDKIDEENPSR